MKWLKSQREHLQTILQESGAIESISPAIEASPTYDLRHLDATLQQSTQVGSVATYIDASPTYRFQNIRGRSPNVFSAELRLDYRTGRAKSLEVPAFAATLACDIVSNDDINAVPCNKDAIANELLSHNPKIRFNARTHAAAYAFQAKLHRRLPNDFNVEVQFSVCEFAPCRVTTVAPATFPCTVRTVSVHIGAPWHQRYSFEEHKHEPRQLTLDRKEGIQRERVLPPVEPPEPPPASKELSLRDRLLWLLTPPIHELLADPQLMLPEKPYPFQMVGIKWLMDRDAALLADEMGLGKTMQAIIAARLLFRTKQISQVLIICPKSLIPNWRAELRKWWPNVVHHVTVAENDRQRFLKLATPNIVVKIVNYEKLAKELDWLKAQKFSHDLVILDEAQNIKKSSSRKAQAVKALIAKRRWALTGTPLENHLDDVISIFGFVKSRLLTQSATVDVVRQLIRPYFLRRKTEEVIKDLPELIEQTVEIELTNCQLEAYERLERDAVIELNAQGDSITVQHIFAQIQKLKQLCNFDPKTGESAKFERLLEDFSEISSAERKALVFSQFVEKPYGLKEVAERLDSNGHRVLQFHGDIPDARRAGVRDAFCNSPTYRALLLNYKTGGVGLNLQAANYVFLFDRWWNPAVEDQAIKRAHRIGSTDKVFVRRFICKDTIEERIEEILAKKRRLFQDVIEENRPHVSMGLTEDEIFSLFDIKVRPRRTNEVRTPPKKVLDKIDWKDFQQIVAEIYERQGYSVRVTGAGPDGGIDIIAEQRRATAHEKIIVQCKHQCATVGRPVCQQLLGTMTADLEVTSAAIVTSSSFSREAVSFAGGKRLKLIGRTELLRLCRELKVAEFVRDPSDGS